jgi:ketosteroid isomerase-like protein
MGEKPMGDAVELAERFIAAIEAGDLDTMTGCYAPDAVVWHNTDGLGTPGQDRETNAKSLRWMRRYLKDMQYEIVSREPTPSGFVQHHVLRATTALGEPFALPAAVICTVANDQIVTLHEYFREADLAPLMKAVQQNATV